MKINKIKIIRLLFISLFSSFLSIIFFSDADAGAIVIVKDHQPKAFIVLPDSASVQIQNAAKVLQDYIKQSTGAILPIANNVTNKSISIHIGLTAFVKARKIKLNKLDEDGFILQQIDSHNFIIVGGSDWGTEFGVYSFLERFLGVLWLMPTELGVDVPIHPTLTLPQIKVSDSPAYFSRQTSYSTDPKGILGTWAKCNRLKGRLDFHHNLLNLIDLKDFGQTNPEFYPLLNGKRKIPLDSSDYKWQPNFSAPGIVDSASAKIVRYFNQNPKVTSYSLGINDWQVFDQSPQSLARRSGKKNYLGLEDVSNDYFKWANEVVKKVTTKYPDKKFGLLAYNNVATPPSKDIGVNPNIIPFLTYERMRWAEDSLKEEGHKLTRDWEKVSNTIGWYDYAYGLNYLIPRVWFHEMKDYLIWGTKHHVKYYYAELYPNWGEGPKSWILSKLLWNPYQNVDSLLNIWYVRFAGVNAADKLNQFYSIWEKFWTRDILASRWDVKTGHYLWFNDLTYLSSIPEGYLNRADALIKQAYDLADNGIHKQRVLKLKQMWDIYHLAAQLYSNNELTSSQKLRALKTSPEFIASLNNLANDPLYSPSINLIKLLLQKK